VPRHSPAPCSRGYPLNRAVDMDVVRCIKEAACYVAADVGREQKVLIIDYGKQDTLHPCQAGSVMLCSLCPRVLAL
jgi:hypothetical protein